MSQQHTDPDTLPLHIRYRPRTFTEVVGQPQLCRALQAQLARKDRPHTYLLVGPSGCGKTTIGRLIAKAVGATGIGLEEVDAATYTGIDNVRTLTNAARYKPLGGETKCYLIDECHALSANAWKALLKATEEPAAHCYWVFCTTDAAKVPATIKTRCAAYEVKPLAWETMADYLETVAKQEGFDCPGEVVDVCAREAKGSPRQGLVYLAQCATVTEARDARELIQAGGMPPTVLEFCRMLAKGGDWAQAMAAVRGFEQGAEPPESVRLAVCGYFSRIVINSKSTKAAGHALAVLDAFAQPWYNNDRYAPMLRALGQLYYR